MGFNGLNCNCCGPTTPLSACLICCDNLPYTIEVAIPDGVFSNGDFCAGCESIDNKSYFLNNFTVLNDCDWLVVDVTNVCEGSSTSISAGLGIRSEEGSCIIRFRLGITCSGFPSFYDWEYTIPEGCESRVLTLSYTGNLADGDCCLIADPVPDITVYL